jgi:hypothetical protein
MSLAEVEAPVRARPDVPSAIQTDEPEAPGPTQPEGKPVAGVSTAAAEDDVAEAEAEAEEMIVLRSALRLASAAGVAKSVKASDPPHIEVASPEHAICEVEVFERAAPLLNDCPHQHSDPYLEISSSPRM